MTTDTRLQRPIHLAESPVHGLTLTDIVRLHEQSSEPSTVEFEGVRVLLRELQATEPGRHRAPETPLPGERPTGHFPRVPPTVEPAPVVEPATVQSWLPGEGPTRKFEAAPSFPRVLPDPSPRVTLLALVMRAAQRLRGVLGGVR
jgi:hypothetical protein